MQRGTEQAEEMMPYRYVFSGHLARPDRTTFSFTGAPIDTSEEQFMVFPASDVYFKTG